MILKMPYSDRRNKLKEFLKKGTYIFFGNNESPMNYKDNTYRFRQDSTFLYYFGINEPGLIAIIDIDKNQEIIFGEEHTINSLIWEGKDTTIKSMAEAVGVPTFLPKEKLSTYITNAAHFLPPYRADNTIHLAELLHVSPKDLKPSKNFIKAVAAQRSIKDTFEIEQMELALKATKIMHETAMRSSFALDYEYQLKGKILNELSKFNMELAYPLILSTNGQVLHNHYHGNQLKDDKLVLIDTGAEALSGYASDITRTFPVGKTFTQQQKEIYSIVLKTEEEAITTLKPGKNYKESHIEANISILSGLKELGLVNGDPVEAANLGVGGLFMPHGLGHLIGLDVHDMEDLGEHYVGYLEGQERSDQMGLGSLRFAKEVKEGFTLTVEPGIYFIPALINKWKSENKFNAFINYSKLEKYYDFGGIRIEDNILITEDGHQLMGEPIAKSIKEIEDLKA